MGDKKLTTPNRRIGDRWREDIEGQKMQFSTKKAKEKKVDETLTKSIRIFGSLYWAAKGKVRSQRGNSNREMRIDGQRKII